MNLIHLMILQSMYYELQVCKACSSHNSPIIPYGTGTGLEGGIAALQVLISPRHHFEMALVMAPWFRAGFVSMWHATWGR